MALSLSLLMSSADNFCKQFGPRAGPTKCRSWSGSKLFDTLIVFLKDFVKKADSEKIQQTTTKAWKLPSMQKVKQQKNNITSGLMKTLHLLIACWVILYAFVSSADFFQNKPFQKILSGIPSDCQTLWIQIRLDRMSSLIWVQTVCKGYQQMAKKCIRSRERLRTLKNYQHNQRLIHVVSQFFALIKGIFEENYLRVCSNEIQEIQTLYPFLVLDIATF